MASAIRSEVEEELRNQFRDLQLAVLDGKEKMRQIDVQLEVLSKDALRNKLVRNEIGPIEEDTRLYQSLGRMFYLQSKTQIIESLKKGEAECEEGSKLLQDNKTYLEKGMKDKENNLREFINHNVRTMPVASGPTA
jgi:prefoldin subunit 1